MCLIDKQLPNSLKFHDQGSYKLAIYYKIIMWQTASMSMLMVLMYL